MKKQIDANDLPARIHELELTVGALEWMMLRQTSLLNALAPGESEFPFQMDWSFERRGFEYRDFPQLPAAERNLLIGYWHGQGRTVKEIQVLLYSRGHASKSGQVIRKKVIERIIEQGKP